MFTRVTFVIVIFALALGGVGCSNEQTSDWVIVVAANYPGASAQEVADSVAHPIEQQINGVEGMVRIESESHSNGEYIARIYFARSVEAEATAQQIQKRVALAEPKLPDEVRNKKTTVEIVNSKPSPRRVIMALTDLEGRGWAAQENAAEAIVKRLTSENALDNPQIFPTAERQVSIEIDREKCAALGISVADVSQVLRAVGTSPNADAVKKAIVSDKVTLDKVAKIVEVVVPVAIIRIDFFLAIRISGTPPGEKSVAATAAKCIELAQAEADQLARGSFNVINLSENK